MQDAVFMNYLYVLYTVVDQEFRCQGQVSGSGVMCFRVWGSLLRISRLTTQGCKILGLECHGLGMECRVQGSEA